MIAPLSAIWGGASENNILSQAFAWFDFSDASTVVEVSGFVDSITDKNGSGRTAIAPSAGARPVYSIGTQNGLNKAIFDGSFDVLQTPTLPSFDITNLTYFIVAKYNGILKAVVMTDISNDIPLVANRLFISVQLPANVPVGERLPINAQARIPDVTRLATMKAIAYQKNGDIAFLDINEKARYNLDAYTLGVGNAQGDIANRITLGDAYTLNSKASCDICEYIIFNQLLSDTDIDFISNYLIAKWGL